MSNGPDNNLTRQKIQELLAAVGSQASGEEEKIEAADYDFTEPHYFNERELEKLGGFAKRLAGKVSERFQSFFNAEFEVTVSEQKQHFAGIYLGNEELWKGNRHLVFSDKQNSTSGIVTVAEEDAMKWLGLLLGEVESQSEENPEMSELERSLLYDIVSLFARSMSATETYLDFQPAKELANKKIYPEIDYADELFKIGFDIKKKDSEEGYKANIVIRSKMLDKAAGRKEESENKLKGEEIKITITEHLSRISVPVTVQLGTAELTFEDLMSLQVNDVVLTGLKINQSAQIFLEGNKIFDGTLARLNDRKAFVVTGPAV